MSKLIPIIDTDDDRRINLLQEYKELFDYVICESESEDLISKLIDKQLGVIPIVTFGSTLKDRLIPRDGTDIIIKSGYQNYLNFIIDNMDNFNHVLVGSEGLECCGYYDDASIFSDSRAAINRYADEIESLCYMVPELGGKIIVAPMDWSFERDAYLHRDETSEFKRVLKNKINFSIAFTGFWCLYENYSKMANCGYDLPNGVYGYEILRKPGRYVDGDPEYPYDYYKNYLKNLLVWSGIGYLRGAELHHLKRLIEFGYQGCVFYLPHSKELLDKFLIDV